VAEAGAYRFFTRVPPLYAASGGTATYGVLPLVRARECCQAGGVDQSFLSRYSERTVSGSAAAQGDLPSGPVDRTQNRGTTLWPKTLSPSLCLCAFVRYRGDTPGSRYYVNDLLSANGLRYVWLNVEKLRPGRIALPENRQNGRATILQPVTMDDGIRYWRFERCYGFPPGRSQGEAYLRDSAEGVDTSHLITEPNLEELCRVNGTCILSTHWTHPRSMPIADETLGRFKLLWQWRESGKIWVTTTARLLEWTRRRTFLGMVCRREGKQLAIEIEGLNDPIFGHEPVTLKDLDGLCIRLKQTGTSVTLAMNGQALSSAQLHRSGGLCWIDAGGGSSRLPPGQVSQARPDMCGKVAGLESC